MSDEICESFTDFPNHVIIFIGFILYVLYFYDVILSYFLHCNWITLKMSEQPGQEGRFFKEEKVVKKFRMKQIGKQRAMTFLKNILAVVDLIKNLLTR